MCVLTYKRSFFRKRYAPFVIHLEFFLKCKINLKRSIRLNSCITDVLCYSIDFWWSHSWTVIKYWDINFNLLCKIFPIYCYLGNFSKNIKGALKQVRVTLWRTDVLHHCNRLSVIAWTQNLINKKTLIRCVLRKNAIIGCNVWNFFSNVQWSLKKVTLNSFRTDVLYCNRLLMGLDLNFDTILT